MNNPRRAFLQQIGLVASGALVLPALPGCRGPGAAAARPGRELSGISYRGVIDFLDALQRHEMHSLMIVRRGQVVAEGWWAPYERQFNHGLYSLSKSFTSTAVGFAVAEGRLKVTDPVLPYFPGERPENPNAHLAALRVRDLLTMSSGHGQDPTFTMVKAHNWAREFLAGPFTEAPGTRFLYNSGATYMLSALVQKLTGQRILDYLRPRLFEPLGVSGATWETCPRGINTGGWGLSIRTEAIARFARLYLQKGRWENKALLPESWVEEATRAHIQQPLPPAPKRPNAENDWVQGYGYQFWRSRHGFRGDGAFGQFALVLPEQETVVAMTGESPDMQGQLDLVWKHLLPALAHSGPRDPAAHLELQERLRTLALPLPVGVDPGKGAGFSGKTFVLEPNELGLRLASLFLEGDSCRFLAREGAGEYAVRCGFGHWERGLTTLPGVPPRLVTGGAPEKGTPIRVAGAAAWKNAHTLEMTWRYTETPHHDTVTWRFDGNQVRIEILGSIANRKNPVLVGRLA